MHGLIEYLFQSGVLYFGYCLYVLPLFFLNDDDITSTKLTSGNIVTVLQGSLMVKKQLSHKPLNQVTKKHLIRIIPNT